MMLLPLIVDCVDEVVGSQSRISISDGRLIALDMRLFHIDDTLFLCVGGLTIRQ